MAVDQHVQVKKCEVLSMRKVLFVQSLLKTDKTMNEAGQTSTGYCLPEQIISS